MQSRERPILLDKVLAHLHFRIGKNVSVKEKIHYPAPKFLRVDTGQTYLKVECDLSHYTGHRQCKEAKVSTTPKGSEIMNWSYCISYKQKTGLISVPIFYCGACMVSFIDRPFWWDHGSPTSSRKLFGYSRVPRHIPKSWHSPCRCTAQCCCTGELTQHGQAVGTLPPALRNRWCMGVKPATSIAWCIWEKSLRVKMHWRNIFLNHERNQVRKSWKIKFKTSSVFSKNLS